MTQFWTPFELLLKENMLATIYSSFLLLSVSQTVVSEKMVCSSSVCIPKDYNKLDLPTVQSNETLKVNMSLFLIDIYQINPKTYTFNLNFVLKLKWLDNRINITSNDKEEVISAGFLKDLWKPELYMWNAKGGMARSDDTVKSGAKVIKNGGDIMVKYTIESEADLICVMMYGNYPFDTNICSLEISSFGHFNDSLVFQTVDPPPDEFLVETKIKHYQLDVSYVEDQKESWDTKGKFYSTAGVKMVLKQESLKCLLVFFLPASFIFIIIINIILSITIFIMTIIIRCTSSPPPCSRSPPGSRSSCRSPPTPPAPPSWSPSFFDRLASSIQVIMIMLLIVMLMVLIIMTMIIVIFNPVVNNTPNEGNGLTALEVWVLSNIGLVFLAFLAYALLLAQMSLQPFRDIAPQKNQMSPIKD